MSAGNFFRLICEPLLNVQVSILSLQYLRHEVLLNNFPKFEGYLKEKNFEELNKISTNKIISSETALSALKTHRA